ncbi:DUF7675 family protein [Arcanobacterium buesumense]|uniref:DUF7675 family protein n=1 Tax=Arcanobacterium buesumense TaxID=2722751 RepID=UPI003F7B3053
MWQVSFIDDDGMLLFDNGGVTFDKKTAFSLFRSFPHDFTQEQIEIIKRQLPHWYDFFSDRL